MVDPFRTLAVSQEDGPWSLTTLREKLIKRGSPDRTQSSGVPSNRAGPKFGASRPVGVR